MLVTPIKNLPSNSQQTQIKVIDQKQPTPPITNQSITLRTQFLQSKLSLKQKRIQCLQQKSTEQTNKIEQLQQKIIDKQIKITNKIDQIRILQKKVSQLQIELSKYVGKLQDKNRQIYKMDIQIYRDRKQNDYHDKVSKMLTKQNHQLIAQKNNLKLIITQLTQKIQVKEKQKQQQLYNNKLLTQLNQTLRLQIQQLLFQIRMLHRKQETARLNYYEGDVDKRISLMGKYRDNKSLQLKIQENQEQSQMVNLLKLKINSLQQQLAVSDRRCKQLQTIVLSQ